MSLECISYWIEHHPGLASWVQAVGSIASIWAAFLIGNKQIKKQDQIRVQEAQRRSMAFYAVVKNAAHNAITFGQLLESNDSRHVIHENWKIIFGQILRMSKNSLSQIPPHELGRFELVESFLGVAGSIETIISAVERSLDSLVFEDQEFELMRMEALTQCRVCEMSWRRFEEDSKQ